MTFKTASAMTNRQLFSLISIKLLSSEIQKSRRDFYTLSNERISADFRINIRSLSNSLSSSEDSINSIFVWEVSGVWVVVASDDFLEREVFISKSSQLSISLKCDISRSNAIVWAELNLYWDLRLESSWVRIKKARICFQSRLYLRNRVGS